MRASACSALLAFACILAAAAHADAQCQEGRVSSEATQGRCCWPGQSWDAAAGRCTGAPTCPAGRVASGDDCVVTMAPDGQAQPQQQSPYGTQGADQQQQQQAPTPPPGYQQYGGQPQPQGYAYQQNTYQPEPAYPMKTVTRPRVGFVILGSVLFGVTYIIAAVTAVELENAGERNGGLLAIPVAGPFTLMANIDSGASGAGYAYLGLGAWGLAQAAGITFFILGFALQREVQVRAEIEGGPSFALTPQFGPTAEGGSQAGLTLSGTF